MIYHAWLNNPHWEDQDPKLKQLRESPIQLPHLDEVLEKIPLAEGIFSILGPRQVGKSTLLRLIVKKCLKKLSGDRVLMVEGDEIESWRELKSVLLDWIEKLSEKDFKAAILIDEITSIPQWHRAVKSLADQGKLSNVLMVYTGSSTTSLKEGGELFPGRRGKHVKTDFELLPVSYRYLHKYLSLEEYFLTGGFPWSVNEYLRLKVLPDYVGEIYWSWIKGEFLKRGKSDILLRHCVEVLVKRTSSGFSHNTFAREMGIASNDTARQYLELLMDCFAIYEVLWMDLNQDIAPRKNRKYYPIDPLLFHLFQTKGTLVGVGAQSLTPEFSGQIAEGIVCQELKRRDKAVGYWSGKREIDFVRPEIIEVKYQNRVQPHEFDWFGKTFRNKKLLVLTKNDSFYTESVQGIPLKEWLMRGQ
ncbi:MAG: ATP-binding protein [Chlamydiae bacterium]|nr:ATP-binding protein [Chlamydiota bacterium]